MINQIKRIKMLSWCKIIALYIFIIAIMCSAMKIATSTDPSEDVFPADSLMVGVGLYIDSHFIAAVHDENIAQDSINAALKIKTDTLNLAEGSAHRFLNNIEIKETYYPLDTFTTNLTSLLCCDDNPVHVMSYDGSVLPIELQIQSTYTYTENFIIAPKIEIAYTDKLYEGVVQTTKESVPGAGIRMSTITSINGTIISEEDIASEVITEPIHGAQQIGAGPEGEPRVLLGEFAKPYDGYISSYAGPRGEKYHQGIDITGNNCNGKPAVASHPGKVIHSGWYGGYGYCVIIEHENNIKTLYAHFQKCLVAEGDEVQLGDNIGIIGSTGNSTGPHVHFEVLVEGEPVNPLLFVDYK